MRKLIAIAVLLTFMLLWIWGAATAGTRLAGASPWLQLVFYILVGFGWILPLRPLLKWMNANEVPDED